MATYGVVLFYPDKPCPDDLMLLHVLGIPVLFLEDLPDSQAVSATAATADTVFSIQHTDIDGNVVEVATCTFAAGEDFGTYTAEAAFGIAIGETLSIIGPAIPDATLADIAFTIQGETGNVVNLKGRCESSTAVFGRLSPLPPLAGHIRTGRTQCVGRLSVTHDPLVFNV